MGAEALSRERATSTRCCQAENEVNVLPIGEQSLVEPSRVEEGAALNAAAAPQGPIGSGASRSAVSGCPCR